MTSVMLCKFEIRIKFWGLQWDAATPTLRPDGDQVVLSAIYNGVKYLLKYTTLGLLCYLIFWFVWEKQNKKNIIAMCMEV